MEMKIGEVAAKTGVSVRSLRHYEAQGLIHALRRPNDYRDYPPRTVETVTHIKTLLACGFSLRQIQDFTPCYAELDPVADCEAGREQHLAKLAEIDSLMASLAQRRKLIVERLAKFHNSSSVPFPKTEDKSHEYDVVG
jgi:DNA-binding transcriptional MerR regulator